MRSALKQRAESPKTVAVTGMKRWKLEDAKARFSEVVRRAGMTGPQLVTVRGKEAAIVIAPEQYRQLLPKHEGHVPLVRFLQETGLGNLEVEREFDPGREIYL